MKHMIVKKTHLIVLMMLVCLMFTSCAGLGGSAGNDDSPGKGDPAGDNAASTSSEKDAGSRADVKTEPFTLEQDTEFGGIVVHASEDDLDKAGFKFGDSVDVTCSNGYELQDIPYYNGYYTQPGETLLISYPGDDFVKVKINYGDDVWQIAKLKEGDTAEITLHEQGKYEDIQHAMNIQYEDERSAYDSDEEFANFRGITAGNIREGVLYRGASPCDNKHNRASYVNKMIKKAGVKCILDLADSNEEIDGFIKEDGFDSPYFLKLYKKGAVIPCDMSVNVYADDFRAKVADGLSTMAKMKGPYYIHCLEGKDRTGFVCVLVEALAGASYDEIAEDYMLTYKNYYGITEATDKSRYDVLRNKNVNAFIQAIAGDVDPTKADLSACARKYLNKGGMTNKDINKLLVRVRP